MPALSVDFGLPPERALDFFRAKGLQASFDWRDMQRQEHDRAFTVAKLLDMDLLADVQTAVDQALADGKTFAEFRDQLTPLLQARGWWGTQEMTDPETGEQRLVQLGSARRLQIIYDTNLSTSYAAGHWQSIVANAKNAPYLLYNAVDDDRTREQHRAWDNTVLRWDDAWWQTHYPPNGWRCRCSVIQLSERDLRKLGKSGPDKAPSSPTREWLNPRTKEVRQIPEGIDPGWDYHPGRSRQQALLETASSKLQSAPPALAREALRSMAAETLANWMAQPEGVFPLALLEAADAELIGSQTTVVGFSADTVAKQAREHGELKPQEYLQVQTAIEQGERIQDSPKSLIFIHEAAGYVTVVKATKTGRAIFMTSFRRLSSDQVKRDQEISRLRDKRKNEGA